MISWIFKYGVVVLVFNTVLLSIKSTFAIGQQVFLSLMIFYSFALVINPVQLKKVILNKSFAFLLILNIVNLVYFIFFHSINDIDALQYLLARIVQFSIVSFSVYFSYNYYKDYFLNHIVYLVFATIIIGLFVNPNILEGRYFGVIWNANMLASFSMVAFSIVFLKKTSFNSFFRLSSMLLFLIVALSTGSRGVILALALLFIFKYGLSLKNIAYSFIVLCFYFIVLNFQFDTSFNRFAEQDLFNDRLIQYNYAYQTIMQNPFFGSGLDKYAYIDNNLVPMSLKGYIISAHNGYLALLTQYGFIIGSFVIFIILRKCWILGNYFKFSSEEERTYVFIFIYALFASIYETMLTGINEFHTILFWFSLAYLSFVKNTNELKS
ncbi:MAG: O-antigen ligase family protein [Bacteroidota bacterium]|nr:O-antigen ligase family protein [Bacteroidota bacterium]